MTKDEDIIKFYFNKGYEDNISIDKKYSSNENKFPKLWGTDMAIRGAKISSLTEFSPPRPGGSAGWVIAPVDAGELCSSRRGANTPAFQNKFIGRYIYQDDRSIFNYSDIPYAVTFTYPKNYIFSVEKIMDTTDGRMILIDKINYLKDCSHCVQWDQFKKDFDKWLILLKRQLAICPNNRNISRMMFFPEHTKEGQIHVHGLINMNNNYYSAVSDKMALAWHKVTNTDIRSSIKYKNGFVDKAFDRCNDVNKWIQYITKENKTNYQDGIMSDVVQYFNDEIKYLNIIV